MKSKILRNSLFIFMLLQIFIEIASFIVSFILFFISFQSKNEEEEPNMCYIVYSLITICLEILSIYILIIVGINSLYFKKIDRLVWYIVR